MKAIKRIILIIVGPFVLYLVSERYRTGNIYTRYYKKQKILKNTIFYESRDGNSITDSPYAIFKYLLNNKPYSNYVHIWSVQDFETLAPVIIKYKNFNNVKFVKRNSRKYLKYLSSSEYLINNSTFQTFFQPNKGQKYINTWHGTPLKKMGFDIPGSPTQSQNVVRNFLCTDYLISPNLKTTKMFTDSYRLKGLYSGKIIEAGYPRIDLTLNTDCKTVVNELQETGLKINIAKKNILYAPTWKGTDIATAKNDVTQIITDMNILEEKLEYRYNILIKVHPFLYNQAKIVPELREKLVPDFFDTNEALAAIDVLITDYSSIFFDFLVTEKPIIFYTWDLESYEKMRGMDFKIEDLPGPSVGNVNDLSKVILNLDEVEREYKSNYDKFKQEFTKYEDGNVTAKIVQALLHSNVDEVNVIECFDSQKQKILIYAGGMYDNGITISFLNLMNNIDYEKYDVSCFTGASKNSVVLKNISAINKNAHLFFKPGIPNYTFGEAYRDKFTHLFGEVKVLGKFIYPEKAYKRESSRLFGCSSYDYVVDFSGYSFYWAKIILATDAKRKTCFMHNDMLSDSHRVVDGKKIHRINVRGIFSVYHRFDRLASVSKGTMELNREKLTKYADYSQFNYVPNTVNLERILHISDEKRPIQKNNSVALIDKNINFVTMGRLSPEKGQDNLIKAFSEFYKINDNGRLFILGDGPLERDLRELINTLKLQEKVFLLGQHEKPFEFLRKCDCFVFSSHYEGQPLVLLEAMTLGMKIIATDIVANRTVLEDGKYGLLVENSVEGLTEGLLHFDRNSEGFEVSKFNYHWYSKRAIKKFVEVCC